jgi:3-carboxy-cis,cis-muconate cycloisomerase
MSELFDPLQAGPDVSAQTGDRAFVQAMLDFEAGLARVGAKAGLVPARAAADIADACWADRFDLASLGRRAVGSATLVVPMLADLREMLPPDSAGHLHLGATSQDVLDTALMLVCWRALRPVLADLATAAEQLARLAESHRSTVHIGRTLLQQAGPTTFGAVCAGWLVGVDEARATLSRVRRERLAVQLGGAVGTLARYGDRGPELVGRLAAELGLTEPVLPWHTSRGRIAELASALGTAAGTLAGIALDVALLSQTEVGELAEGSGGGSSAMPHKRNPARSVLITACAHRTPGLVATILAGMPQEQQRAAGRWQAEAPVLLELLRLTGGAAYHARDLLHGLRVDAVRMRGNLELTRGVVFAEPVTEVLAGHLGRADAGAMVTEAARTATAHRRPLRDVLDESLAARPERIPETELDTAFDPRRQLGAAELFVDRAVAAHRRMPGGSE